MSGGPIGPVGADLVKQMRKSGIMLAQVTNITDPDKLGRVKCKPISLDKDVAETDWCFVMTPAGGNAYGLFWFPNVDDLVIVSFLNGNVHHPLVLGSYWADKTVAPYPIEDGKNEVISLKTPAGSEIKLEEGVDKQKITITTPSGTTICINDEAKDVSIGDKEDKNHITFNWDSGEMELKAEKKITLLAGETSVILEESGSISMKASKSIVAESAEIGLKASSALKAEGATAEIRATQQLSLSASGPTELKGATVNIN